jgi:hypothetical protein
VIGELAKQLILQAPSVPPDVWSLFQKHSAISIDKAQQIFCLLLRSFDSIFIFLDALANASLSPEMI